jgi:nitroimidazol reductase NimA-like FMN-containing flavoprotein (pyridoxamine 5'-phosphate oxidase superfamily)
MRRKDKEITDVAAIEAIIENARVCRLAMADGNTPYMVPLSFGYRDRGLYFHSAPKGRKIDLLRKNPQVCFEFEAAVETITAEEACSWGMQYQSVIGFGRAEFIDDADGKRRALAIIMAQYDEKRYTFPENTVNTTAVFRVTIASMSGKQSGFG